jgi:DNA-binding MarR family transcriptional regulator
MDINQLGRNKKMEQKNDQNLTLPECACRNLRMTTRVITQYYDKALHASGLKSPQFSLLNDISSREDGISVNELADQAMMDQTTVTRNVEMLRKKGYVDVKTEDSDSRKKCITVSETGKNKLALAMPHWLEAQMKLEQIIGKEQYLELLKTLSILREIK